MVTVAIIGMGNRGRKYAAHLSRTRGAKLVAICDRNPVMLEAERKKYGLDSSKAFLSEDDFFGAGKLADAMIISTQDRDHYRHAMQAMALGYDLLLEKPVSPVPAETEEIAEYAKAHGRKVVVCHVLRYAGFYDAIKNILDSGELGEIVALHNTENIGYWHFAHSYVRGNWRREDETAPSILAKCCHDLDIIYYFTGKHCKRVFSTGKRSVFLPENAPAGCTAMCHEDCKAKKNCPFDAAKIYYRPTRTSIPQMIVQHKVVTGTDSFNLKRLKEALKTSPYGRCVYRCDNDVMETQIVSMQLEDGVQATLTMTAFSNKCYRNLQINCTKGEIYGNDKEACFYVQPFGQKKRKVKVNTASTFAHLGGDKMIIEDFVQYLSTGKETPRLSLISETLESHRIAYAAERSRKEEQEIKIN